MKSVYDEKLFAFQWKLNIAIIFTLTSMALKIMILVSK